MHHRSAAWCVSVIVVVKRRSLPDVYINLPNCCFVAEIKFLHQMMLQNGKIRKTPSLEPLLLLVVGGRSWIGRLVSAGAPPPFSASGGRQ